MRALVLFALLLVAFSVAAPAQPGGSRTGTVLSPLPSPDQTQGNRPSDYLRAAQSALTGGRTGEAEEALERAQTRMLDRSVPLGQTNDASDNPTIGQISQARQALAARNRVACLQLIETAIGSATAQGF
jgi:hypothetical protein